MRAEKNSLSSVFETVLSETVFGLSLNLTQTLHLTLAVSVSACYRVVSPRVLPLLHVLGALPQTLFREILSPTVQITEAETSASKPFLAQEILIDK